MERDNAKLCAWRSTGFAVWAALTLARGSAVVTDVFHHVTSDNGLPIDGEPTALAQDHHGFLRRGSQSGLIRSPDHAHDAGDLYEAAAIALYAAKRADRNGGRRFAEAHRSEPRRARRA